MHGGKSTGAKTEYGKLVVSRNAYPDFPYDLVESFISKENYVRGINAYDALLRLMFEVEVDWHAILKLVEVEQIPLEATKYMLMYHHDPEALIIIQIALDSYYMDVGAQHLLFHSYTPMSSHPKYYRQWTEVKRQRLARWEKSYKFPWERKNHSNDIW